LDFSGTWRMLTRSTRMPPSRYSSSTWWSSKETRNPHQVHWPQFQDLQKQGSDRPVRDDDY
jgi:hypothetical protein